MQSTGDRRSAGGRLDRPGQSDGHQSRPAGQALLPGDRCGRRLLDVAGYARPNERPTKRWSVNQQPDKRQSSDYERQSTVNRQQSDEQ